MSEQTDHSDLPEVPGERSISADQVLVATREPVLATQRITSWAVERGVEQVTVADIAAAADVSPRTYFNYFSSREQAFVADDPFSSNGVFETVNIHSYLRRAP